MCYFCAKIAILSENLDKIAIFAHGVSAGMCLMYYFFIVYLVNNYILK